MPTDEPYVIIGGGIAGASIAYHLSERTTTSIAVYERQALASETTYKSMAMYGLYGDETQYRMKRYGLRLYNQFFTSPAARPRYDFAGRLTAATTPAGATELRNALTPDTSTPAASGADRDLIEYIPGDELHDVLLLPGLATDTITGALFRPRVGFMQPQELAHEFVERARANGVTFHTGERVTGLTTRNDQVTGVNTPDGPVPATAVVCAAGPWTPFFLQDAGIDVPVRHTLAPILKLRLTDHPQYSLPAIGHHESPYAIYRQRARSHNHAYLGYNPSTPSDSVDAFLDSYALIDPDTTSETIPTKIRNGMLDTADLLMPSLLDADIVDEWVGIRSGTPDGNPIVGWTEHPGLFLAAFHTSGIQLAPKTGDIIAAQLVANDPTPYYETLSITRFDGYTDIHDGNPPPPTTP